MPTFPRLIIYLTISDAMKILRLKLLVSIIAVLCICEVTAQQKDGDYLKEIEQTNSTPVRVAGETDLGWSFYYPDDLKSEEDEEQIKIPPPTSAPPSKLPKPMSVEWFTKHYPTIRDRAVDQPTRENLRAELYAQKVMMDKSEVFARKRQYMQKSDPFLQEGDRLPMFGTLSLQMIQNQESEKKEALKEMFMQSGLMVFYDENCQYCRQSITIINLLSKNYPNLDIRIYARNTAQPDVVQGLFSHIKVYPDDLIRVSEKLNITHWPSYVLVTPDNNFSLIARGMVNLNTLTERVLVAGFEHGTLGKEWFDKIHHTQLGLIASNKYGELPEGVEDDPVMLINSVLDMINGSSEHSFYDDLYPETDESKRNR